MDLVRADKVFVSEEDKRLAQQKPHSFQQTVEEAVQQINAIVKPQLTDDFVDYCEQAAKAIESEGAAYLAKAKAFDERCIAIATTIREVAVHHSAELNRAASKADKATRALQTIMDEFHNGD